LSDKPSKEKNSHSEIFLNKTYISIHNETGAGAINITDPETAENSGKFRLARKKVFLKCKTE